MVAADYLAQPTDLVYRTKEIIIPTAKDEVRRLLEALPDDATLEDVQYSIYVRERIERAHRGDVEGKLIEHDEIEDRMRRWLDE